MSRRRPRVEGVLFDCYGTLIDILTDEHDIRTYRCLSRWLLYQGVRITPRNLRAGYLRRVQVEEVFAGICAEHSAWEIDAGQLGVEAARAFRAASLRRLGVIRKSQSLLDLFGTRKLGVVSNGQRVFSEQELRVLNLYDRLNFVIFSSDFGYQKPDPRIYTAALGRMNLLPENVLFIGDNHENDVTIPRRLGMQALHVEEAWRRYGT